jgi:L-seryl-tRNA(Ser) seleniumtransferase
VVDLRSTVGGGSLPGETLPSIGVALSGPAATKLLDVLRNGAPPIVARIEGRRVVLDLRTVDPASDAALIRAVGVALGAR